MRIGVEHTKRREGDLEWKINIKNADYDLYTKDTVCGNYRKINAILLRLLHKCTLLEIRSAIEKSNIPNKSQLKICYSIDKMIIKNDLIKKNDQLEKKLDVIEDKFNIIIAALDLQNQNALNRI